VKEITVKEIKNGYLMIFGGMTIYVKDQSELVVMFRKYFYGGFSSIIGAIK